jgi:hypothetical protein
MSAAGTDLQVEVLGPTRASIPVADLLARVGAAPVVLPFDPDRVAFLADFARRLGRRSRGEGGPQALAYWLRKTELARMREEFDALDRADAVLMPRGLTFHIPPANVDTIFVYSLALALITGNRSVVRMSSRVLAEPNVVLEVLLEVLAEHPSVEAATALVTYGHDDRITAALSGACDVRVVWGGDATIARIRTAPLAAHARDVTFADRFSLTAIATAAYVDLPGPDRDALVERFFNDTYWFDQMGCSSPRTVVWVGPEPHIEVAADFHARLEAVAERKGYRPEASVEVAKLSHAYRSIIDMPITGYQRYGSADTVLEASDFPAARGEFCGGGLLYQWHVPALAHLVPHVRRQDQTLGVHGIPEESIRDLVRSLAGRGIDRIVPIGHALDFGRYWDGYDLFAEFTRRVAVDLGSRT